MTSVEKVLWILKRLGEAPYELGVTELAREMGHGKSGIYKILLTLVEEGFVVKNDNNKKYSLGPAVFRLGHVYSEQKRIWNVAEPIMRGISEITKETVSIGILEGNDAILAYKIESPHAIRLYRKVGRKYPLNAGAIGKLLAAYNDPKKIEQLLLSSELKRRTPNTIVDPQILKEEYQRIRDRGYAISDEENTLGAFGISAPIWNKYDEVIACLCLAGPKEHFKGKKIETWISLVVNGAKEISYRLGYQDY